MPVRIHHDAREGAAPSTPEPQTAVPRPDRNRIGRVTDETGRVLGMRRVGLLQRLRLLEVVGAENGRNEAYMNIALLAAVVVEIDGEPCAPVASKAQLEARVLQIGEHGAAAVSRGFAAMVEQDSADPEELAKKRLGDPELMSRLSLVKRGIPYRDAFDLAPDEELPFDRSWVLTFEIGFGLLEGRRYDWKVGRWLTS